MKNSDRLREAKKLIEAGWTKGYYQRDSDGHMCDPEQAVSYCVIGACQKTGIAHRLHRHPDALPSPFIYAAEFNDHPNTRKEDILAFFDKLIAAEEANGN